MTYLAVALLTLGIAGQRLAGMFLIGPWLAKRPILERIAELLPAAVVAALIAQLTFTSDASLVLDERGAGMVVAAVLVWRRAPFVVVVLAAAAVTAILRAL